MENKIYEFKGATVEEAVQTGLAELNLTKDDVTIEVINKGGFISRAQVRLLINEKIADEVVQANEEVNLCETNETNESSERDVDDFASKNTISPEEMEIAIERCNNFINELIEKMCINCEATVNVKDNEIFIDISGKRTSSIIGHRGEVLDCIQYFALMVVNKGLKGFVRVHADSENYRARRTETLESLARRLARTVSKTGKPAELEPMNPYERRIIHAALANDRYVTTESHGEGRARHVVIKPSRNNQNNNGYGNRMDYGDSSFKKKGPAKTKSFGYNNKKF